MYNMLRDAVAAMPWLILAMSRLSKSRALDRDAGSGH
jgi:hypothetical protein